jgi:zinc protease
MLLRGTRSQTRQQVREEIDRLQARVRVLPAAQSVTISIEVRRPNLSAVLDLVAECLRQPALSAKELEELRRELQSEYQQNRDDPTRVGMRGMLRLWHRFPKGHPLYVSSFEELIEDLRDIRLEDVRELHSRFYGTQDALGAVVGDFDPRAVNKQMVVLLGDFRAPERYVRVADPFSPGRPQDLTLTIADKPMAFLGMGLDFALRDDHPDYAAMRLADNLLGGGFLSSRVPQRLRERDGFSYGAGTVLHVSGHDANAALFGYAIYGAANLAKVEQGMREELTRAVDAGFTAEELRLGREGLLREREQLRADDEELVDVLREQLDLGRTMAFEQQLDERLRRLTAAEVGAALRKYVDPRKLSVLRVGDFKQRPKAAGR